MTPERFEWYKANIGDILDNRPSRDTLVQVCELWDEVVRLRAELANMAAENILLTQQKNGYRMLLARSDANKADAVIAVHNAVVLSMQEQYEGHTEGLAKLVEVELSGAPELAKRIASLIRE
jgi:hypothetical protein